MGERVELHNLLENLLAGVTIYFQPPTNVTLVYPCLLYRRLPSRITRAGNNTYGVTRKYKLTLIDDNPDTIFLDVVLTIPNIVHETYFTKGNLNHDVFVLHF